MSEIMKLYGNASADDDSVYHIHSENGCGEVRIYNVFDGIQAAFNEIRLTSYSTEMVSNLVTIEINYCMEGRYECSIGSNSFCYITSGDFSISAPNYITKSSYFPSGKYRGISIFIETEKLSQEVKNAFACLGCDICKIEKLIQKDSRYFILRSDGIIKNLFGMLYKIPIEKRVSYLKLTVPKLLLYLSDIKPEDNNRQVEYVSSERAHVAKRVHQIITADISKHYTIDELASFIGISPTALKLDFKSVYGTSVYAYLKEYRLNAARDMLAETSLSIAQVANDAGYENPSKFSSAFKDKFELTPMQYRKSVRMD